MLGGTIGNGGAWRSPFLQEYMPITANVDDDRFYGNIRSAVARSLLWLQQAPAHDGHAVIVGGGPSLIETLPEIKWRYGLGQTIVALNNTATFLTDHGILPHYHVILDARASNARFVIAGPVKYLIASQCAPETFDAAGDRVVLWHPHVAGIEEIVGPDVVLIGGGTTVGLQSMAVMFALGYRKIHLYGLDSSCRGLQSHAYAQPENENDEIIRVEVNGHAFYCARWMAHQADEFKNVATQLADADCVITVAGDGLLPFIARMMMNPPAEDAAVYDLGKAPASWDFSTWLIKAEMDKRSRGVTTPLRVAFLPGPKDGFRDDGLPVDTDGRQQMLDHVMRPLLSLVDAVEDAGAANGYRHGYLVRDIAARAVKGEDVPRFMALPQDKWRVALWLADHGIEPGSYLTITLREADHWTARNSNRQAWISFARRCGHPVVFVRDTAKADDDFPLLTCPAASKNVLARAALYAQAKCNLFIANGPFQLCLFGDAPYLVFKLIYDALTGTPEWVAEKIGIPEGTQPSWANARQRIVWADDTLENIEAAFADFLAIPQTEKING